MILVNKGLKIMVGDVLDQEQDVLNYKNFDSKKSKKWHFSKGLTNDFAKKLKVSS